MALYELSLASLSALDSGRVDVMFKHCLERVIWDCKDRCGVKDARKIRIEIGLTPVIGEDGDLMSCNVTVDMTESTPKRKSPRYDMGLRGKSLVFHELFEEEDESEVS